MEDISVIKTILLLLGAHWIGHEAQPSLDGFLRYKLVWELRRLLSGFV